MTWHQSNLRRLSGRLEELQGGTGEMLSRLGSIWPVPLDCEEDAAAVREGLAVVELPMRRLQRKLRAHLPDAA
jgi:hypothetical protein